MEGPVVQGGVEKGNIWGFNRIGSREAYKQTGPMFSFLDISTYPVEFML